MSKIDPTNQTGIRETRAATLEQALAVLEGDERALFEARLSLLSRPGNHDSKFGADLRDAHRRAVERQSERRKQQ